MFRPDNYTSEMLRLAKTVKCLDEDRGVFQCDGLIAYVSDEGLPKCECDTFKADCACIHLDAIGYVNDMGTARNEAGDSPASTPQIKPELSIHPKSPKLYTTRADRARQIVDAGMVEPVDSAKGLYHVQSQSSADSAYTVDLSLPSCTCPDEHHLCKHIQAAQIAAAILARPKRTEWNEELDEVAA